MNRRFRNLLGFSLAIAVIVSCAATSVLAQTATAQDPLVQVLVKKGVLTADDAKSLSGTSAEQHDRLIQLLKNKGVISNAEYNSLNSAATPSPAVKSVSNGSSATLMPAVLTTARYPQEKEKQEAPKPAAPTFVPAVAPVRVLQFEPSKPGGFVPDIKIGKVGVKPYGFFKASAVYDTSSPNGDDFPLPGFLGDTSPNGSPEFHLKARASRFGANFEFPDPSDKIAVTGKLEFDWEGNFSRADNRNISSVRSNMPSLRLAYGRIDYKKTPETGVYFLAGQDWSTFGSSILPNQIETTGLDIGFGSIYTRVMQMRVGFSHIGSEGRKAGFGADFAIAFPGYGNLPPFIGTATTICPTTGADVGATSVACTTTLGPGSLANQLGYGERQGADSGKPALEGRLVFQWQLDKSKGVAPAQIIVSGMHATRALDVPVGNYNLLGTSAATALKAVPALAHGFTTQNSRYGWTAGLQLPTRFVTFVANYYRGAGLRWYFAGQIYPEFSSTTGFTGVTTANTGILNAVGNPIATPTFLSVPNVDGSSNVLIGLNSAGVLAPVPQLEPRAQGGFAELEFPLSRIFNANPEGRNAGWVAVVHYGYDSVFARDVRKLAPGGGRAKGDVGFANLQYKMNQYVTLAYEFSYYRTRAVAGTTGGLPLFEGLPARQWHDLRSEFATIFTF
jgi:hypothetical protein